MSEAVPETGSSPLVAMLFAAARRLGSSVLPFVVVILCWQFASLFFPRFLFPSLIDVFWRCLEIFSSGAMFADVVATILRILVGLAGAFIVGGLLALLMVRSRAVDNFLSPILTLFQGIPALSWVVFAIIWFHGVEFRIFIIMVMTTLPAFTSQVLGALRDVPGPDGDGVQFPSDPDQAVPGDDRAGDPAGHSDGLESQSRQCFARGRGRRTGRRHRRRRLSTAAAATV